MTTSIGIDIFNKWLQSALRQIIACQIISWICQHLLTVTEINKERNDIKLVPRHGGGKGERAPGIHCLCMCLIATEFCGDHVHMWWCHKLAVLMCQLVFCLSNFFFWRWSQLQLVQLRVDVSWYLYKCHDYLMWCHWSPFIGRSILLPYSQLKHCNMQWCV